MVAMGLLWKLSWPCSAGLRLAWISILPASSSIGNRSILPNSNLRMFARSLAASCTRNLLAICKARNSSE